MTESEDGAWRLRLLDHFGLSGPGGDAGLTANKAIALLIFLALARDRTARRDTVANLLWENVDTAQGRVNLRQALSAIRRAEAGKAAIIEADVDTLKLAADVHSDADSFDVFAAGGLDERLAAADLYRTDLVAGFAVRDAPAFNEWLSIAQAQWRQKAIALLLSLVDEAIQPAGDLNAGATAALKLLAIDPFNEAGHRGLMRIYARQGRAALALAQYRSLADLLRRELQVAPDAETQALYEEVRKGRRQTAPSALTAVSMLPPVIPTLAPEQAEPLRETIAGGNAQEPVEADEYSRVALKTEAAAPRRYGRIAAAGLAFLALVLAVGTVELWRVTLGAAGAPRIARIFPVASSEDQETGPALSPDGTRVVYSMSRGDNIDLYLTSIDEPTDPVRLTANLADDLNPAWRPDGRAIAFVRTNLRENSPCSILIRAMPTGPERLVGACRTLVATQLTWSADGRALYFRDDADPARASQVFRLPMDGGAAVAVTHPPEGSFGDARPAFSSDGGRMAFIRRLSLESAELISQNMETGEILAQGSRVPGLRDATWSRGDAGLIYSVLEGSGAGLWWRPINARDRAGTRLSTGLLSYSDLSFSKTRNRLVFQVSHDRRSTRRLPATATAATDLQPIAGLQSEITDRYLAEASDGRLLIVSGRSGSDELWLKPRTGRLRQLTRGSGLTFAGPVWSPDGRAIAVSATRDGQSDIYLVSPRTGRLSRVTNDTASDAFPAFSADGRFLFWSSLRGGVSSVWLTEPRRLERPARQLAGSGIAAIKAGAPGDNHYYYTRWMTDGLFRRPFDASGEFTGAETLVVPELRINIIPNWALAGGTVVYTRRDADKGATFLYRRDLRTGFESRIEGSDALDGRLALSASPDGSALVTRTTVQNDISGIDFE